eukprot:TRINITY_DN3540_c0_g1_i1.p1 TRINITY_DN3540_c0_g1~~TRINITY_DN3540_c0_g1_i1.p1  ORF type:complete len:482 (+),score=89.50 TRINITY_DN3540_c0_g1_i1:33-1478(+)
MGEIAGDDEIDQLLEDVAGEDGVDLADLEDDVADELEDMMKYNSIKEVAHLLRSTKLAQHLGKVEQATMGQTEATTAMTPQEYAVIVESNHLVSEIETDVRKVHKFLKDHYAIKFPELESLILEPLQYARVVQALGNEMDTTNVDLTGILPPHTIMVVNVTGSTTQGRLLSPDELARILEACDEMIQLDEAKQIILEYLQSRMGAVAPNLSVLVGTAIAAQLIGIAGGLDKLARLPSNIIHSLGRSRKTLVGFSTATAIVHGGLLMGCDLVKREGDPKMKKRVVRILSGKVSLAARIDACTPAGAATSTQRRLPAEDFREEVERRVAKLKEPPPPKQEKPLPAPDDSKKTRRGGARARAAKERYKMTEMRKFANRIEFAGNTEELVLQSGASSGMLGKMGSGMLRLRPETKVKSKRVKTENISGNRTAGRGKDSGLSSSLVFTPVQAMELPGGKLPGEKKDESTSKYFSATQGFATPLPRK